MFYQFFLLFFNIKIYEDYDTSYCCYLTEKIDSCENEKYDIEKMALNNNFKITIKNDFGLRWNDDGTYNCNDEYEINK